MCRNIKQLRYVDNPPSEDEVREAARQFVRKVSGYRTPSRANQEVFEAAINEISASTWKLLDHLVTK